MTKEINFYSRKEEYGWLSNFYRSPQYVNMDSIEYPSNEHFYQSQKTKDITIKKWIASAPNPFLAMKAGRSLRVGKELINNWNDIKVRIMLQGLRAKFNQSSELKQKLLNTENAILHENSPTDMFWGKRGQDILGKLLMEVREELKKQKMLKK